MKIKEIGSGGARMPSTSLRSANAIMLMVARMVSKCGMFKIYVTLFFEFFEYVSPVCGVTDTPVWTSGDVSSGFQSQSGQPYSRLVEAYVIYVRPCDLLENNF